MHTKNTGLIEGAVEHYSPIMQRSKRAYSQLHKKSCGWELNGDCLRSERVLHYFSVNIRH